MKDLTKYISEAKGKTLYKVDTYINALKKLEERKDISKIYLICEVFYNILLNCGLYTSDLGIYSGNKLEFNGDEIGSTYNKWLDKFFDELTDNGIENSDYSLQIFEQHSSKGDKLFELIEKYIGKDNIGYRNEYNQYKYMVIEFSNLIKKDVYCGIRSLYVYLANKKFNLKTTRYNNEPEFDQTVYDYNGEEWKVIEFAEFRNKSLVDYIISNYDTSGNADNIKDIIEDGDIVVAVKKPYSTETQVFVWGPEGVWYKKNKDSPEQN